MGVYGKAIITTAGRNLIAQALAGNESVRFTELKTSDYKYASTASLDALTDIPNVKQTTDITSALVTANSNVKVSAMIRNSGLTAAYYINTIGIYGNTPGFADTLIAVISAVTGDLVPAYSGSPFSFVFDVNLIIQNASNLNVSVNDAGVATVADLNALWEKAYDVYITNEVSGDVVTFPDGADMIPMKSVSVNFSPIQSFNGYDAPWPAGGGKNLLNDTINDIGTFSGVTVSQNEKGQFVLNGTATMNNSIRVGVATLPAGSYVLNGMKSTGDSSTFFMNIAPMWNGVGNQNLYSGEYSGTSDTERQYTVRIYFRSGQRFNNMIFEPMIRLASESDATFAPYSNICPISGWNAVKVTRTGKNLVDISQFATQYPNDCSFSDGVLSVKTNTILYTRGISVDIPAGSILNFAVEYGTATNFRARLVYDDDTISGISMPPYQIPKHVKALRLDWSNNGTFLLKNFQVELGSTATGYEPYTGATYTNNLPSAFFGGTMDFVSGLVSSEWAEISSYSGETLPGEWLSSYDVYAPGTTPTNGAQVVYKRSTPVVSQIEPKDIYSVYGINTVWSDQNNINLAYRADTKLYIDAKIAETQALALENS